MPDPDRPLTDAQERALIVLADQPGKWVRSGYKRARTHTLDSLEKKGLCEMRLHAGAAGSWYEARITQAGLDLANSMGD